MHTPLNKLLAFQAHERGNAAEGRPVFRTAAAAAATAAADAADADANADANADTPRPPHPPPSCDSDDDFCDAPIQRLGCSQLPEPRRGGGSGSSGGSSGVPSAAAATQQGGAAPLPLGVAQPLSDDSEEDRPLHSRKRKVQRERVDL